MKIILTLLISMFCFSSLEKLKAESEPYEIELEQINMPGTPAVHSFAFAEVNGKWLVVGGRTNGLHGFNANNSFPKQYSNKNMFVIDPVSLQTWSKNIFTDCAVYIGDPLRSTNMQYYQSGNKLYVIGGYGYDSVSNSLITFPTLTVIDIDQTMQAIISGTPINYHIKQFTDPRLQICGGELQKIGDYYYLIGGHNFSGTYTRMVNQQIYSNQIRKFKIIDDGVNFGISDYSASTDTMEYHRRDMNVVPAIRPDGISKYLILYGGVFKYDQDLPYLNPIYIDENGANVDFSFEQKMSQYTCSYLTAFNSVNGSMHTTFFGGTSLYSYNEINHMLDYDSLVPFIDDITTISKKSDGTSAEIISKVRMPALLGTNAKFILNNSVPHFDNGVIKLNEVSGRTFAGYIFGGIRALFPNNNVTYPSEYVFRVYITPKAMTIKQIESENPNGFVLSQNYPNPFNPVTNLEFETSQPGFVSLKVFDMLGHEVASLVNERKNAGRYLVQFDASNLSSGVYYYKLVTGNFSDTKKMTLVK